MKIAISSTGKSLDDDVDARFGRCPYFVIVDVKDKKIGDFKVLDNRSQGVQGGAGVSAAKDVVEAGAEIIISSNFGPRAVDVFKQFNVKMYQASGKICQVVDDFINGKLKELAAPTGPQHRGMGRLK